MSEQAIQRRELTTSDNIARYYPKSKKRDDGRPSPAAFVIREDECFLSTNWLEHFHCTDRQIQIRGVAKSLKPKLGLKASGRICILNVGDAMQACQQLIDVDIEIWLLGEVDDPSHTGIYGYKDIETDPNPTAVLSRIVKSGDVFSVPADLL